MSRPGSRHSARSPLFLTPTRPQGRPVHSDAVGSAAHRSLAAHRSSQDTLRATTDPRPGHWKRARHPAVWIREGPSLIQLLHAAESRSTQRLASWQVDLTSSPPGARPRRSSEQPLSDL
ncbi:hypothetical protein NDU88_005392 [Pleurodeles waltl]|uniref:Uncharacterized protein n=1 Tax=Pleurodeles waltl TaxID=8319 RepID=A0AAV7TU77_PLEWA|nr:hypothetical protein NDU88_005392 [Pleurodeles waltl]